MAAPVTAYDFSDVLVKHCFEPDALLWTTNGESLRNLAMSVADKIGMPLVILCVVLELARQYYRAASGEGEIKPLGIFLKVAIFGALVMSGPVYSHIIELFTAPFKLIAMTISENTSFIDTMLAQASDAINQNASSPWSFIINIVNNPVMPLLVTLAYLLTWAFILITLLTQKVFWVLFYCSGPIFIPFIIFTPLKSFFENWLRGFLSVMLWGILSAIVIKLFYEIGLATYLTGLFANPMNSNLIETLVVGFAMVFTSLAVKSLSDQLFGFSFSSPISAGGMFGISMAAFTGGTKLLAKAGLKLTQTKNVLGHQKQSAFDKSAAFQSALDTSVPSGPATAAAGSTDTKYETPKSPRRPSVLERLFNKSRSISELSNQATPDQVDSRTSRIQAGLLRKAVAGYAGARNPFTGMVSSSIFGHSNFFGALKSGAVGAGSMASNFKDKAAKTSIGKFVSDTPLALAAGWTLRKVKNAYGNVDYALNNIAVTPYKFSSVGNEDEVVKLASNLEHFSNVPKDNILKMVRSLKDKGYTMNRITRSMETLNYNFRGFDTVKDPETMVQKIMDLNSNPELRVNYKKVSEADLWQHFKKSKVLSKIEWDQLSDLKSLFSPSFIMAAAKAVEKNELATPANSFRYLKSYLAQNKDKDRFEEQNQVSINQFVNTRGPATSKSDVKEQIRRSPNFNTLSDKQIDSIMRAKSPHDVSMAAAFLDHGMQITENPYKVIKNFVNTHSVAAVKVTEEAFRSVKDEELTSVGDSTMLSKEQFSSLSEKYSAFSILTAVESVRRIKSIPTEAIIPERPLFKSGETPSRIKEGLVSLANQGQLNSALSFDKDYNTDSKVVYQSFTESSPSSPHAYDVSSPVIKPNLFEDIQESIQREASSSTKIEASRTFTVFPEATPQEYKEKVIERFASGGFLTETESLKALQIMAYTVRNNVPPENITPEYLKTVSSWQFEVQNEGKENIVVPTRKDLGDMDDNFKAVTETLMDNYSFRKGYEAKQEDFLGYLESHGVKSSPSVISKVWDTMTPTEALQHARELDTAFGMGSLKGEEIVSALADMKNGKVTADAIARTHFKDISPAAAVEYLKTIPSFTLVSEAALHDWGKSHNPQDLARKAFEFHNMLSSMNMNSADIVGDFDTYLNSEPENNNEQE